MIQDGLLKLVFYKYEKIKDVNMDTMTVFLSDPLVASVGYFFSLIAACIAIWQFLAKSQAISNLKEMKIQITNLKIENTNLRTIRNSNKIQQGQQSQYFQDNSGHVNIDNRG